MLQYRTQGFNPYSVSYSPFYDSKIAVASAANFGLVGNGRLYVLDLTAAGQIVAQTWFDTQDGLFDLAWSEMNENQMITSSGDGTVKLYDIMTARPIPAANQAAGFNDKKVNFPLRVFHEHTKEVFSVNWNLVEKHLFCSASWDGSIKVWNPERAHSIATLVSPVAVTDRAEQAQTQMKTGPAAPKSHVHAPGSASGPATIPGSIHSARFCPHNGNLIASVHADSHVRVWDTRAYPSLTHDFLGHGGLEALTVDWNKYAGTVLATGGVDKAVKVWDIRMVPAVKANNDVSALGGLGQRPVPVNHGIVAPVNEMLGHDYAVRKVAWSPHSADNLLSTSYDMTARVWSDKSAGGRSQQPGMGSRYLNRINHGNGMINVFNKHTEFVMGADWSLWGEPGWVATVGWDEMLYVWKAV